MSGRKIRSAALLAERTPSPFPRNSPPPKKAKKQRPKIVLTRPDMKLCQIGRVIFIANGINSGKLATIVDILDGNRVLVDGPTTGVLRGVRNLKDLQLTKFLLKIRVGQRTKGVKEVFKEAKINDQFGQTTWAKKIAAKSTRAKLTDFERFKLMKAKQARNHLVQLRSPN